jgi:hypothetical protein
MLCEIAARYRKTLNNSISRTSNRTKRRYTSSNTSIGPVPAGPKFHPPTAAREIAISFGKNAWLSIPLLIRSPPRVHWGATYVFFQKLSIEEIQRNFDDSVCFLRSS